jgi:DNA topoisomerase-1
VVKNGRYGPYASHDGVNATLPSHLTPETITLEEAVGLLEARSARGGKKPAAKPRAAAPKAASKPKAAAKPKPPARASKEPPRKSGDQ